MLLHSDKAVAYHRFGGPSDLTESLRGLEWSVLAGSADFGDGRVEKTLFSPGAGVAVGRGASDYGTFHGVSRLRLAAWVSHLSEGGASLFMGFMGPAATWANGIRLSAYAAGALFPLRVELVNSAVTYAFPASVPDIDGGSPPVPHLLVVDVERQGDEWSMRFSVDGGVVVDGGALQAPRIPGPPTDAPPETVPDDEVKFGLWLVGGAVADEVALWADAPRFRRAQAARTHALWMEFREPLDAYTDRFGVETHDPAPRDRRGWGDPCRVNRPPEIDGGPWQTLYAAAGSLLAENEITALQTRMTELLESGKFPHPDPTRRQVPWPMV